MNGLLGGGFGAFAAEGEFDEGDQSILDVAAVAAFYPEWTAIGKGVTNYLACPDFPLDEKGTKFETSGGHITGGDLASFKPITKFGDEYFKAAPSMPMSPPCSRRPAAPPSSPPSSWARTS